MSSSGTTGNNPASSGQIIRGLSATQRRAFVLRDELRWTEREGVDKVIEGLSPIEPPQYQRIDGVVQPPLVMVTLMEKVSRFPLGNVYFDGNARFPGGVYLGYLTFENGAIEIRTEAASPLANGEYDPEPIHSFVAENMVNLFGEKYRASLARMNQINQMRQVAFNIASQQPVQEEFRQGETFLSLAMGQGVQPGSSSKPKKAKKRKPGDPVVKHATNTREQLGLESIPQEAKTATFNAIPTNIKVDFFNNVIRTAFPNFDNLMIASWNVVSIYSNVGTDFPDLHKSIVELKSVLQDFEQSFGSPVSRKDPKVRKDFAPQDDHDGNDDEENEHNHLSEQPMPDITQDELKDSSPSAGGPSASSPKPQDQDLVDQEQNDNDSLFNETVPEATTMPPPPQPQDDSAQMPPPRLPPRQQQASNAAPAQPTRGNSAVRSSSKVSAPARETSTSRLSSPSNVATGSPNPRKRPRNSSASSQERATVAHSPKLHRKRDSQISSPQTPSSSLAVQPLSSPSSNLPPPTPDTFVPSPNNTTTSHPNDDDDDDEDSDSTSIPPINPNAPTRLANMSPAELFDHYQERRQGLLASYGSFELIPEHYRKQMKDMGDLVKARQREGKTMTPGKTKTMTKTEGKVKSKAGQKEKENVSKQRGRVEERAEDDGGEVDVDAEEGEVLGGNGKEKEMPKYLGNSVLGGKKTMGMGMGMAPVAPMMVSRRETGGGGAARKGGE